MRPTARSFRLLAILLPLCFAAVSASEYHKYQLGDPVTLWVNKVGPYDNPQETYNYYSLPFCQQAGIAAQRWGGLGEVLGGNELIDSQIEIKFRRNVDKGSVCALELDDGKVKQFQDAIKNFYWQELFIDDLPLWGFVGEVRSHKNNENKYYLFTHKDIVVNYNGDQIIYVNFTPDGAKLLEVGRTLDMTYSVKWVKTNITFAKRFDVYLDYPFFEHQIHWFSIFNSFMMVLFLTGLVSMILMRTLRNDYAKYAREDDDLETTLERDASEESGWKLIHGDVFRPPPNLALLSAVVGTGAQLTMLVLLVILLAIIGMLYVGRGAIITAFIVCYALTSFISGNELDQVDGPDGVALPLRVLRDRIRPEHHRHLLRLARRHPLRHDGGGARHLGLRLVPAGPARHRGGPKLERRPQQPLPREDDPPAHPPEEMVPHPAGDLPHGRPPPLRQHLHRDVLRLLLLLELQGVLRLRLHAAGVPDPRHRHHLCDHRGHLLPAERRELQLAVDLLLLRRLHGCLRLPLLHLLLPREDQDVRPLPDQLLLRLHPDALPRPGHPLRCCGLSGFFPVRQENLQEHQMRLGVDHRRISLSLSPSLPRSSKNPVDLGKNRIYIYQSIYLSAVVSADGLHPVPERQFSLLTYQRPHKNRVLNPETFRQRVSLSLSLTGVGG